MEQLTQEERKLRSSDSTPIDHPFERRWAMGLFHEALRRCEEHFRGGARRAHWELFEARVLLPSVNEIAPPALAELAAPAGFKSPALAAAAVQTVKRRMEAVLREVVVETVEPGADVDAELAEVRRFLCG
ncbi:MAG: hypothetical protein ACYS0G_06410 [Planctomycetota bacterium]|jgi:hypothetical protein